jgi:hypothetical protein
MPKSKISKITNSQNHSRKSKFPYILYTFTGKLDLTDVHLPGMHLMGVYLIGVYLMGVYLRRVP